MQEAQFQVKSTDKGMFRLKKRRNDKRRRLAHHRRRMNGQRIFESLSTSSRNTPRTESCVAFCKGARTRLLLCRWFGTGANYFGNSTGAMCNLMLLTE